MESYYSLVYYRTNSLTDEYLVLALFAGGGEGPFMHVCDKRLKLLREIVHKNTFLAVRRYLFSLQKKTDEHRTNAVDLMLFDPVFAKEELTRLKHQLSGNLDYSEPTVLNEWLTSDVFDRLAKQFLGTSSVRNTVKKRASFHLNWRTKRYASSFSTWKKDVELTELAPKSTFNFRFDLVDPTEKKLVKGLDFDWSAQVLHRKIQELAVAASLVKKQIILVSPTPKTKRGKEQLAIAQTNYSSWLFLNLNDLSRLG